MYLSEMKLFERVNYNKMVLFQNQNKKEKGETSVQYHHTIRLKGPMEDVYGERVDEQITENYIFILGKKFR